ncbi:DUF1329 domain-containing protein [Amphritea japonica]|uniref:DUF1329 domain-containing protein n=1 Tax=Amphritea japonica ATCC BAA-1530 TaxID=1278309 RepID=A0A7R6P4F9_9GAMM|nr:DUF1329 domain-containing protein [Amphritea japonica]BBB27108.1 conserved hypothetical protein [Amphritea japonica ATCC BAA-1530]
MKKTILTLFISCLALNSGGTLAAVSEQKAAQLANELTPVGAERSGNMDGSIPEWTGGMSTPPAGYKPGGTRVDPFADEKPLFTINASNYQQYAEKLSAGQKALFEKYPETFQMPIYPTHRTAAAPQWVYDNTKQNALTGQLSDEGNSVEQAYGGYPFPIPATGHEVIWNHLLRWNAPGNHKTLRHISVYPNGDKTIGGSTAREAFPFYDTSKDASSYNGNMLQLLVQYEEPVRRKGEVILLRDPVNAEAGRQAWQYIPGQRRVRRAPTIGFDTPNTEFSGLTTYDDAFMFNGSPERFDWKLVGKKELYVAYNNNGLLVAFENGKTEEIETPNHLNPAFTRWELHRVWEVEATVKEGQRHVYGKRTFYLDEDTWNITATDIYDGRGELWRVGLANQLNAYDIPATVIRSYYHIDLQSGAYALNEVDRKPIKLYAGEDDKFFTPAQVRKMSRR